LLFLTKLDGSHILVGLDAIKYIEGGADTRLIFLNGDSLIIKESLEEISQNVIKLKASILSEADLAEKSKDE
jgi:uncharacterized protein YlzI (FlbEa/FlbD family)